MDRRAKLLLAALLLVAGVAIAFVGSAPEALATVSEAKEKPAGSEITLRGSVKEGSLDRNATPVRFVVTDGARELAVEWARPLPEHEAGGSLDGRTVVLEGVLRDAGGERVLDASRMQVGCASKYEQA